MNLGELKKSLKKFSSDMDDAEILIQTGLGGETQYDMLTFIATIPKEEFRNCIVLGSLEAARILVKNKKIKVPDDYVPGGEDDSTNSN